MIIVSGKVKVKPGSIEKARAEMTTVIAQTRGEAGCIEYSYGIDVLDPNTIIILEYWVNEAALRGHFVQPYMTAWLKSLAELGVVSQQIRFVRDGVEFNPFH